jgi:glycosyltransferase involved in cell wall biosynthesis
MEQRFIVETSAIIPSRNRPDLLGATVRSILQGEEIPTEIVIIDQSDCAHPTLQTFTPDRACKVRYFWTDSRGVSQARNEGISAARYDILVFADDDVLADPAWFRIIVRSLIQAGRQSVVTGRVLPIGTDVPGSFVPSTIDDEVPAVYSGRVGKDVLYSNNMAMYRFAIDEVGMFDTRLGTGALFPSATDNDWGYLALEAGFHIAYIPAAILYHRAWRNEQAYLPLRWRYGVGRGAFYAKYMSLRDRYMLGRLLRDFNAHGLLFLHHVPRQYRRAAGDAVFMLGLLWGAVRWLLTQKRS